MHPSARRRSPWVRTKSARWTDPLSSSPSYRTRTRSGRSPIVARYASIACRRAIRLPLLSDTPRTSRSQPPQARLSLRGDGRRPGLALTKLAARRERRDLDPALLAEVMDDPVDILERLAAIHLGARDHEDAVAAVSRKSGPRA